MMPDGSKPKPTVPTPSDDGLLVCRRCNLRYAWAADLIGLREAIAKALVRAEVLREVEAWMRAEVPAGRYHADALAVHFNQEAS